MFPTSSRGLCVSYVQHLGVLFWHHCARLVICVRTALCDIFCLRHLVYVLLPYTSVFICVTSVFICARDLHRLLYLPSCTSLRLFQRNISRPSFLYWTLNHPTTLNSCSYPFITQYKSTTTSLLYLPITFFVHDLNDSLSPPNLQTTLPSGPPYDQAVYDLVFNI